MELNKIEKMIMCCSIALKSQFKTIILPTFGLMLIVGLMSGCGSPPAPTGSVAMPTPEATPASEATPEEEARPDTITLVDNIGREVELPFPVQTVVVANRFNSELIRAAGALDRIIAVDMNTAQDREYWGMFDLDGVIGANQRELNFEKIVQLNPQVLILPENGNVDEAVQMLTPFGIKVFVISGYDVFDFENQVRNIGLMFDVEDEAQVFLDYFLGIQNYIENALRDHHPRRRIYIESTNRLAAVIPGSSFYGMGVFAHADNIFSENIEAINANEVDPEEIIIRQPDAIIKLITPAQAIAGTGLYQPPERQDFIDMLNEIKSRPGWDEIPAVQNNQIFLMSQFGHGGACKWVGAAYIAKWLYPDLLPGLDPDEVFRAWLEDFQGFRNVEGHFFSADELLNY